MKNTTREKGSRALSTAYTATLFSLFVNTVYVALTAHTDYTGDAVYIASTVHTVYTIWTLFALLTIYIAETVVLLDGLMGRHGNTLIELLGQTVGWWVSGVMSGYPLDCYYDY